MLLIRKAGYVLALVLSAVLAACSGSGNHGAASGNGAAPSGTVSGAAAKGLLLNAPVSFYAVSNGVASTTAIGSTTTNSQNGTFSSTVASAGPVVVTVNVDASTQMLDELSGTAIGAPSGLVLHAVFDSLTNLQPIAVTPLTEMAYQSALASSGGLTTTNIDAANNAVSTLFLSGAPALYTQPIALANYTSATVAEQAQAKLLTALDVAASSGTAVGSGGSACTGTYSQALVCLIGGLGGLISVDSAGTVSATANAGYIPAAYASLDADSVTVNGGQSPAQLGLDSATPAETSFVTAYSTQNPLPGFASGGDPLTNTKDLVANIRTNIVDQAATQTFGYAPVLTALNSDVEQTVEPVVLGTSSLVGKAYLAAELLQYELGGDGNGTPSSLLGGPYGIAADTSGNLFVANPSNDTVVEVSSSGAATLLAGQANVPGEANTAASAATFDVDVGIAVDPSGSGNVYVGDVGAIREISNGQVTTLAGDFPNLGHGDGTGSAATFSVLLALTADASGNLYVVDEGAETTAIRKVTPGGAVSTVLPATSAIYGAGGGIAVDGAGNVYVSNYTADIIQKITPAGVVSTFAGQAGIAGDANATGTAATFNGPVGLAIDPSGNLYVSDTGNAAVREITPAGVVTTPAQTSTSGGRFNPNTLGGGGLVLVGGNLYVTNTRRNSIQEVSDGAVTTLAHGTTNYQGDCGYDPTGLGTGTDTVLCRYGHGENDGLLTLTQTGTGTYSVQTQPLVLTGSCATSNAVIPCFLTPSTTSAPLQAQFSLGTADSGAQSASFNGPYYVTAAGGQVSASLNAAESADWNAATGTGTITLAGTLSGGSGGVTLQNATIGSDTAITVQNLFSAPASLKALLAAKGPAVAISGTVDLQQLTTAAFSYAAKVSLGTPVYDASGTVEAPDSVQVSGSVQQVGANGTAPLFNGTASVNVQGFSSFDITQPLSATNTFSTQAQVAGTLALSADRVLTVTAAASASQLAPTPAQPDSVSVTYSYSTPSGTAQLNASGQYDATHGYSGTITNNAGVVIAVSKPVSGALTGTITASGTETATINGDFVYYSDDTSESLF